MGVTNVSNGRSAGSQVMGFPKARSAAAVVSPSPGADHKSSALCLNAGNWFKSLLRTPLNGASQAHTPETRHAFKGEK